MKSAVIFEKDTGRIVSFRRGDINIAALEKKFRNFGVWDTDNVPRNARYVSLKDGMPTGFLSLPPTVAIVSAALPKETTLVPQQVVPPETQRIIFYRDEKGLGDIVSSLSAVQQMRKGFPNAEIIYQGRKGWVEILQYHPDINRICGVTEDVEANDRTVKVKLGNPCPCGEYESKKLATVDKSRNEIFTIASGLPWNHERPKLYLSEEEKKLGYDFTMAHRKDKKLLGIVIRTAETWKDWKHVLKFISEAAKTYTVFTIDQEYRTNIPGVVDLASLRFTIRQLMSALVYFDCVVSPDTGIMHLCDALDVPCVALLGSMKTSLHKEKYPSSLSFLQGKCIYNIPPCMYQVCNGKANYQPCLDNISVEIVLEAVEKKISTGGIS